MEAQRRCDTNALAADIGAALERYRPWLCAAVRQLFPDTGCVGGSDLVQDVLADAVCCPAEVLAGSEGERRAWLKTMLVRKVANALRDRARAKRDTSREVPIDESAARETVVDERASPSDRVERGEQTAAVRSALSALTGPQLTAIWLRYWQDLSLAEIAARLDCSVASVATLLSRGKARLRECLRP